MKKTSLLSAPFVKRLMKQASHHWPHHSPFGTVYKGTTESHYSRTKSRNSHFALSDVSLQLNSKRLSTLKPGSL